MQKPENYGFYIGKKCTIPYKDWPQEVKDYKNWKRRQRAKPEWAHLTDEQRKLERIKVIAANQKKWRDKYAAMTDEEKAEVNKKKGNHFNNASEEEKAKKSEELRQRHRRE